MSTHRDEKPDDTIHGMARITDYLGISTSTGWRYQQQGLLGFIKVGSMANHGGGSGRAAWSYVGSLDAVKPLVQATVREAPRRAANARWQDQQVLTNASSGSAWG